MMVDTCHITVLCNVWPQYRQQCSSHVHTTYPMNHLSVHPYILPQLIIYLGTCLTDCASMLHVVWLPYIRH